MSDFVSLYTALSGLRAAQAGLDTVTDNVTNVATPGHTRRRVVQTESAPYMTPYGPMGSGVTVEDIALARDEFLDIRVRSGSSAFGRLSVRADMLARMEEALAEPELGIGAALDDLWASFEDWSLDPPDLAGRNAVIASLEELTRRIQSVAGDWNRSADLATTAAVETVNEVNLLLQEVAELNQAIVESSTQQGSPAGLLDRRNNALDRLSELVGATVTDGPDGTVRVGLAGKMLVERVTVVPLTWDGSDASLRLADGTETTPGGEIGGYQSVIRDDVPTMIGRLDTFVEDVVANINAAHAAGYTDDGTAGGDLLTFASGSAALTVEVAVTDAADLAAASDPGPPYPTFDGSNATGLADLRNALVGAGGTSTLDGVYRSVVITAGSNASAAFSAAEAQAILQDTAETQRLNAHGVSLDEEMALMLQYQRAYEAAARVLTAIDEALDQLVNRIGVVGR